MAVHGLCRALAGRGHEVEVYTTNVDGSGTLDVPVGTPVDVDGVQVTYFSAPFTRIYWSPDMRRRLAHDAARFGVIHTHAVFLWPGIAAARAARRASVPHVISPRGMLVPALIRGKSRLAKTVWLGAMESRAFRSAAAIHFTSAIELEEAKRVGLPLPHPVVIPNGVDASPRPDVAREERTLVFLGRISWKKGLDSVIEALPSLPGVRFEIAGNDEEELTPRLEALAQRLGVADRVRFHGPLHGSEKDAFLARGTLFVLLSQSENFGNAVLEALAMETPVVLSAEVGVAAEIVAAGAGVIGLSEVRALLDDPARRATMGRNGRALVQTRFGWAQVAQQMEQAYASLSGRAG